MNAPRRRPLPRQRVAPPGRRGPFAPCALLALATLLAPAGCGERVDPADFAVDAAAPAPRQRPPCDDRTPLRQALWGDLHVHTALSNDAYMFDVRVRPADAYRYAFGGPIALPAGTVRGASAALPPREVRIDRPLDFAAVTDHAEFLGENVLCTDPASAAYDSRTCEVMRTETGRSLTFMAAILSPIPWHWDDVCGADGERCRVAAGSAWQETIDAAEAWNDESSACERTTFIAYEYSSHRLGSNLHRNVVFRNRTVPRLPRSYIEAPREWDLWAWLRDACIRSGTGCDALAIPHNPNISNGRMFAVAHAGDGGREARAARARLRIEVEPIVEMMQHKGDSECRPDMPGMLGAPDEFCAFEKFEDWTPAMRKNVESRGECLEGALGDWALRFGPSCLSRLSYARGALVEGLAQEAELGVNPFKFGLMASTDTHNGLAGGVEERSFPGHLGIADATPEQRTSLDEAVAGNAANNPGGLIGVWAEENSRDSIFDAMQRKEVFGSSGPRIAVRFFGGFALPASLCDDPDFVAKAYAAGVPMGGDLRGAASGGRAPAFAVAAWRDPGTARAPGGLLQRLQIVKGWVDGDGGRHQQVFDVAGSPPGAADVDLATCTPRGPGHDRLCTVWRDPDFDAARRAVYYARVLENPSCRYTTWQCLGLETPDPPDAKSACRPDSTIPRTLQERAWSSPIWYTPAPAA